MVGGSVFKLAFLLVLVVTSSSVLTPFIAEARQKLAHTNNGHHHVKYSPVPLPLPSPSTPPNHSRAPPPMTPPTEIPPTQTPPTDQTPPTETPPTETSPSETPPTETPPTETPPTETPPTETPPTDQTPPTETPPIETPPTDLAPSPYPWPYGNGVLPPPYKPHGCHYKCADSNDCDWPCTVCCLNNTCCYDWPEDPPSWPPSPSIFP